MGRKPAAAKSKQKSPLLESVNPLNVNPLKEGSEKPLEDANPLSGQAELEIKNSTHTLEGEEAEPKTQLNSGNVSLKRKGRYNSGVAVRRSARLQDVVPVHNQEIERLIEEVAISDDSEKEEEPPANEETETNPTDSNMEDVNLGERIDYLFRLLNEQQKTIEILKSLTAKRSDSYEIPGSTQNRYKSLYVKSQKKVEALVEENHQLTTKLEVAVAKLDAYEKGTIAFSEVVDKLKDVITLTNGMQATPAPKKKATKSRKLDNKK